MTLHRCLFATLASTPLWAFSTLVAAEATETSLDELVVSASGYEQTVTEAAASITVINQEDINKGAYRDISDVLSQVPGVFVTGGGTGNEISMRGMPVKYTLVLIDGRPQSSRESQANGSSAGLTQDWLPPLASIERIEVIRGPMSTLYGSNAMGGVINIITRKAENDWHGSISLATTSPESSEYGMSQQGSFYLTGPLIEDTLSLKLSARTLLNEEDEITNGSSEKEVNNYNAQFRYTPTDNHTLDFDFLKSSQQHITTAGKSKSTDTVRNNDKESFTLSHSGNWGEVRDESYVQYEELYNTGADIKLIYTILDSRWILPTENHTTTIGGNITQAQLTDSNNSTGVEEINNDQYSLYAEDEWYLADSFSLTTGLRIDKNEEFDTYLTPRLYGNWFLTPAWTLKAGVAAGYLAPQLRQLSSEWGTTSRGVTTYGNSDLNPETSITKEISLIYNTGDLLISGTVFDNDFKDKITKADCTSCADTTDLYYINVDEAKTQGFELSAEKQFSPKLNVNVRYTYTESEQLSGDYEGQPLYQMPLHMFATTLNWQTTDRLKLWFNYEYRGEEMEASGLSQRETQAPSYDLLHIGLHYQINDGLMLQAGIENLMDETFDYNEYGFVDSDRTYWASVEYSF